MNISDTDLLPLYSDLNDGFKFQDKIRKKYWVRSGDVNCMFCMQEDDLS